MNSNQLKLIAGKNFVKNIIIIPKLAVTTQSLLISLSFNDKNNPEKTDKSSFTKQL